MEGEKSEITLDARMINHSGIGTNLKNMIPSLMNNFMITLLGNSEILNSFTWSKYVRIKETKSPIYSIKEQIELPAKIPKCDLFISPHYNIPLLPIKALKRAVIINDVNHLVFTDQYSFHKKLYASYMINAAVNKSDKVLTLSEFSKSEILKYINVKGKEIKVVFCGLDYENLRKNLNKRSFKEIKAAYKLPEEYFLYVGSIKPHKNLITAIKAFNIWSKNNISSKKLVLIGVKRNEIEKNSEISAIFDQNAIVAPGFVDDLDLPLIYQNAECLIFPSFYEGFGLPPIEAMIYGCPVITSSAASLPEVCGDASLYFNPYEVEDLVEKMTILTSNKNIREELIQKGNQNILRFSREKFFQNLKKEFDDAIKK